MRNRTLRILYVCSSWPQARPFGGQLRALHIGRALQQMGEVTVAVVSSDAEDPEAEEQTQAEFTTLTAIRPELQPNRNLVEKLQWAFSARYLNVHGFVAPAAQRKRLLSSFANYDLVWVMDSRTSNVLQIWDWPGSHLDVNDLPSSYMAAVARHGGTRKQRARAAVLQPFFTRRERLFNERFTTLSVCSAADRQTLGGGDHIHIIPNGFARPVEEPLRRPVDPPRIGFIGLYSFEPNIDGVRWFLRESWPTIRKSVPGVRFRMIGKDTDGPMKPEDPDVDALGFVEDPTREIATWSAMVIPIRLGAGTRVKIADGFSRKCPVVSTRLGAFGYEVQHGRELLLVEDNDPRAFASACASLIADPAKGSAMAERAYAAFLEKWTWDAIAPRVWAAAEDCLRRRGRVPTPVVDRG